MLAQSIANRACVVVFYCMRFVPHAAFYAIHIEIYIAAVLGKARKGLIWLLCQKEE